LETEAAALFGKEAAMLVPSGVFANLCAVMTYDACHK
jgi:threonine aldolase